MAWSHVSWGFLVCCPTRTDEAQASLVWSRGAITGWSFDGARRPLEFFGLLRLILRECP